jgi:predicted GH43/DUF377 family glycosyl hydrolase
MHTEMEAIIIPEDKGKRAIFNPTVKIDSTTGEVAMFARGVEKGERISKILSLVGTSNGSFSVAGEPKIVIATDNELPEITKKHLEHSHEDPRFLDGNGISLVGLTKPAYSSGQCAISYLGAVSQDFTTIVIETRLTPFDGRDDRHVFPIENKNGEFIVFSRPQAQNEKGEYVDLYTGKPSSIYVAQTADITQRTNDRLLFGPQEWWESKRIGGFGPPPVKIDEGLLGFYMGIDERDNVYRVGAVLIDAHTLTLLARTPKPLLEPTPELNKLFSPAKYGFGHEAGVVFASGMLIDKGIVHLYCGYNDLGVVRAQLGLREILSELDRPSRAL